MLQQEQLCYGELYGIEPNDYSNVLIEYASFSVRTSNCLLHEKIITVADLLRKTADDLSQIKHLGVKCLSEIDKYILHLNIFAPNSSAKTNIGNISIPTIFKENKDAIYNGVFDVFDNQVLSDIEIAFLAKSKEYYSNLGQDLVASCKENLEYIFEIMEALTVFAHKVDSENEKTYRIQQEISKLPMYRKKLTIGPFIRAYSGDQETQEKLIVIFKNENATFETFAKTINVESVSDCPELIYFLRWCNFSIEEDLDSLFEQLYKKPNVKTVVLLRAKKKTLESIGIELNVTRERVRQIENKAKRILAQWNKTARILQKISAERNGDSVLAFNELEEYFGEHTSEMVLLLKDLKGSFTFDPRLEIFVIGDTNICARAQEFVDNLPEMFHINKLETLIDSEVNVWDLPIEVVRKMFDETYMLTGDTYHRARLSLSSMYQETLVKYYSHGIWIYNTDELLEFRKKVYELFGEVKLPTNDRALSARIANISILSNRGTYRPKQSNYISTELSNEILKYIESSRCSIFLINTLFSVFEEELAIQGVDNKYYLQGILHELFGDKFIFRRDYLSKDETATSIYSEIVSFIGKSQHPVSKDQIRNQFPGVTEIVVALAVDDTHVLNYFGKYLNSSKLSISTEEKIYLHSLIEAVSSDGKVHHCKELHAEIERSRSEILSRNFALHPFCTFSILEHLFSEQFQFLRPYVARQYVEIGRAGERLHELIYGNDEFLISDISVFVKENCFQIPSILEYINSCNDMFLIADAELMMSIESTGANEGIAEQIEKIIIKDVHSAVAINQLRCVAAFPQINIPWTDWLIYSIIKKWGKHLEVSTTSNQFRLSSPIISAAGQMDIEKFTDTPKEKTSSFYLPDNLDNIDDLIADIIEEELQEV